MSMPAPTSLCVTHLRRTVDPAAPAPPPPSTAFICYVPIADGKRKQFEFTATRSVRELIKDAASTFDIPEGDVLLLGSRSMSVTLAGSGGADRRVADAGLIGDVVAQRFPAPKRVIVRVATTPAALGK